ESMLPEILARDTRMPVLIAENDQLVRPNHVYVVPADAVLDIAKGRLGVRAVGDGRERTPIDSFFAALAEDQGEYDRRAQIQQRGDGLRQRGAAVHQRGTGDVEGRAAVGQRGELQTVNHELTVKIDELDRANSDLKNLYESTEIATIFLDRDLIIRSFTPAVTRIFNLIPGDRGRPLSDIAHHLDYPELPQDIQQVFGARQPLERRVNRHDGTAHYIVRALPYWTGSGKVEGVVLTFSDVTGLAQAEEQQRVLVAELNHRVK